MALEEEVRKQSGECFGIAPINTLLVEVEPVEPIGSRKIRSPDSGFEASTTPNEDAGANATCGSRRVSGWEGYSRPAHTRAARGARVLGSLRVQAQGARKLTLVTRFSYPLPASGTLLKVKAVDGGRHRGHYQSLYPTHEA
jgi:hypothetical protein